MTCWSLAGDNVFVNYDVTTVEVNTTVLYTLVMSIVMLVVFN